MQGKFLRFPELMRNIYPLVICPIDDLLIAGPTNGLEDPEYKIRRIIASKPTAILTFYGTVKKYYKEFVDQRIIVNLSASTTRSIYTKKMTLGSIESALRINASAVAFHINICSKYTEEMLSNASFIIEQADKYSIPTVGIIYPRGEHSDGSLNEFIDLKETAPEDFSKIVAHCVQIGVDLGVDLIKTQYSGTEKSFNKVVTVAQGTPVVIAGGALIEKKIAIQNAVDAIKAGAAGISYARNVFGRKDPKEFIDEIRNRINKSFESRSK